jgi:amino acid adenylation domain-containing protein
MTPQDRQTLAGRLSAIELERLVTRARGLARARAAEDAIPRRAASDAPVPLSSAQRRIWLHAQLDPLTPLYNLPGVWRVRGPLHIGALERAFQDLIARHDALRVGVVAADGDPTQTIAAHVAFGIARVDATGLPTNTVARAIPRLLDRALWRPFDLSKPPLCRVMVIRLADEEHLLLVVSHHLVLDAWSLGILYREMTQLYASCLHGQPSPLPDLPTRFGDYAVWEQARMTKDGLEPALAYWRQQLASLPVLDLAGDRAGSRGPGGARVRVRVEQPWTVALRALAHESRTTLFITVLAVFAAWIHRYSGQTDFGIGVPASNRSRRDLEGVIGFFVNTLVVRVRIADRLTFRGLLAQVQATVLDATQHRAAPFDRIVEALQPERRPGQSPLCQVMFSLQQAADEHASLGGATLERMPFTERTARFDITLSLVDRPGSELSGSWNYRTDLFAPEAAAAMERHFHACLRAFPAMPDAEIATVPLVPESDWRRWSGPDVEGDVETKGEIDMSRPTHEWFEASVARDPEAVAAIGEGWRLSYAALNARANRIARHLRGRGVHRGDRVALCGDRSPACLAAMLAILKVGAAYVPLDPVYPVARLRHMIEASGARLLVLMSGAPATLYTDAMSLDLDQLEADIDREAIANLGVAVLPDDAAYVVFTSGSTGAPKGVVVPHRALVMSSRAVIEQDALTHDDCFLQFASLSFDVYAFQVFPALMAGAAVALHPAPASLSHDAIASLCDRLAVTVLDLPAGLWQQWIADRATRHGTLAVSVRVFMTGGETVFAESLRVWAQMARPDARFVSSYGATEGALTSMIVMRATEARASVPLRTSLGRPIAGARAYVLDRQLQPLPIGARGELYIGGHGVASGYANAPEQTADRFIPDPFARAAGQRLYRTGDRARILPDGSLDFCGREDNQIKIRGHRIELSEIEAQLARHPAVQQVAVTVAGLVERARLVAHVVCRPEYEIGERDLQAFVRTALPEHFVPSYVRFAPALPLTTNGKVDRQALPEPDMREAADADAMPATPTETILAGLWSALLGIDESRIQRDDEFFALGGHSLLAAVFASRVRDVFGVELELRAVFEESTLRAIASRIDRAMHGGHPIAQPITQPIAPTTPRTGEARVGPLAPTQRSLWFLQQLDPTSTAYVNLDRVRMRGPLQIGRLEHSVAALIARHEILRTSFEEQDGTPMQVVHPAAMRALGTIDLSACPAEAQERLVRMIAAAVCLEIRDVARAPLLRVAIVRLGPDDHVILLAMHHIVSDGWSMAVLLDEVSTHYRASTEGREPDLSPLPMQFLDYARWQDEQRGRDAFQRRLDDWTRQIREVPAWLDLPYDRPRGRARGFSGGRVSLAFAAEQAREIREWSRRERVTPFMTLLTAWQLLLHGYTGQHSVLVMTPMANRRHTETERLIGPLMNHVPVITRLQPAATLRAILQHVRAATLAAFAHQDLPFDDIVARLQPERLSNYAPLHQVLFNVLNVPLRPLALPGIALDRPSLAGRVAAKFDLYVALDLTEDGLSGSIEFDRDLFDRATIAQLASDYGHILARLLAEPERRVADLSLMTAMQAQLRDAFMEQD